MSKCTVSILLLLSSLLLFISCSTNVAGGSSDHGNARIAGIITDTLATGVANVTVRLIPEDYNPVTDDFNPDSLTGITNAAGYYEINNVPPGIYCLTGENQEGTLRCFTKSIIVDTQDITNSPAVLQEPGIVIIPIDPTIWAVDQSLTVFIPGINVYQEIDITDDTVYLSNIPSGVHTVMIYSSNLDRTIILDLEFTNFFVMPGGNTNFSLRPEPPLGPDTGRINTEYTFTTRFNFNAARIDSNLEYRFTWGDLDTSRWSPDPVSSHQWDSVGKYEVRAQMRHLAFQSGDINGKRKSGNQGNRFYSGWSKSAEIVILNTYKLSPPTDMTGSVIR